jgi:hypothetical protein
MDGMDVDWRGESGVETPHSKDAIATAEVLILPEDFLKGSIYLRLAPK